MDTIKNLSTKEHVKMANKLVKDYKLSANDFPEMQGIQESNATNYYVSSIFRKPDNPAYMPLSKVEDLFEGKFRMLINLVESLLKKKNVHQAGGVWRRNNLKEHASKELVEQMELYPYDPKFDKQPVDSFGPILNKALQMPKEVKVNFIGNDTDLELLEELVGAEMVGMDSEWRPSISPFDVERPGLLQLSSDKAAYLIDLVAFANHKGLDEVLTKVFTNEKTICIGFSFRSDLEVFAKHFPNMQFYKKFAKFIDVQDYYMKLFELDNQIGLAKVALELLETEICKGEQMSNWERRPLRLSQ